MDEPSGKPDAFEAFLDVYLQELLAMPDADVLGGADPRAVQSNGLRMLDAAKAESGRRRLAAAKEGVAAAKGPVGAESGAITPAEAREYLRQATNDPRFTLAARNLGEMTDEDIVELYYQAKWLELQNRSSESTDQ